jgi:hypothetical protein
LIRIVYTRRAEDELRAMYALPTTLARGNRRLIIRA